MHKVHKPITTQLGEYLDGLRNYSILRKTPDSWSYFHIRQSDPGRVSRLLPSTSYPNHNHTVILTFEATQIMTSAFFFLEYCAASSGSP
jgi:hypothetical protein